MYFAAAAAADNAANAAKSLQSCSTLCDPIDGSPPGSSVYGIGRWILYHSVNWEAPTLLNFMLYVFEYIKKRKMWKMALNRR